MLLLYNVRDDWPIFMISASNERLHEQLEYTLLKPDCRSWWISKMQSGPEDTLNKTICNKIVLNLERMPQKRMECFRLLLEYLAWIEHQLHFHQDNEPVYNFIFVTDYLTKMGIKTVHQPPYCQDLAPCDFCLFPKLRSCRYETNEKMKEAVTKVIDTLTHYGAWQKLLERYNKCFAAGGDYFDVDKCFMCVLSIKVPVRKKSGNLFNDHRKSAAINIYIFLCLISYPNLLVISTISPIFQN